jgi:hypothetical protein
MNLLLPTDRTGLLPVRPIRKTGIPTSTSGLPVAKENLMRTSKMKADIKVEKTEIGKG